MKGGNPISNPLVSIVIPHCGGEVLETCLRSLQSTTLKDFEVILVDNSSSDDSVRKAKKTLPGVKVLRNEKNLGFAGGCNTGIRGSQGKYIVLLNNDVRVEPDWLGKLVEVVEADNHIGACQPKILSAKEKGKFDYAGGAGGLLDVFGYPFAYGRIFYTTEEDRGQYDSVKDVFWASGAATLIRKSVIEEVGLLDEDFFAHMEEIDLDWRIQLAGYKVVAVPQAVVYHHSGWTLGHETFQKLYLNHRNSLVMLLKNYSTANLLWIFPLRVLMEVITSISSLIKLKWKRTLAVLLTFGYLLSKIGVILHKRDQVQRKRTLSDRQIMRRMYKGSVVFEHFVLGIKRVTDLKGLRC